MLNPTFIRVALLALLATTCAAARAQAVPSPTRGQLLYSTHCIACHSSQMHWREKKLATDWESLKAQVRRWQATADLRWTEGDIAEVARYLNQTIYRYPQSADRVSLAPPARP
jgi:mono/diheme cytochrome c family protein